MRNRNEINKTSTEMTLRDLYSLKQSVRGRIDRLKAYTRYDTSYQDTPIWKHGIFDSEVNRMEEILKGMQERLDNAKITVEL